MASALDSQDAPGTGVYRRKIVPNVCDWNAKTLVQIDFPAESCVFLCGEKEPSLLV